MYSLAVTNSNYQSYYIVTIILTEVFIITYPQYKCRGHIEGKVNETFSIQLNENASTGYVWAVSQMSYNVCLLDSFYTPYDNTLVVGSGGIRTIIFGGLFVGQGILKFIHVAPWDLLNPAETAIYDITINP